MSMERQFAREAMKLRIRNLSSVEELREAALLFAEKAFTLEDQVHQQILNQIREAQQTNPNRHKMAEELEAQLRKPNQFRNR